MLCVLEVIQEIAMAFSTQTYYSVGWYQLFYFQYMVQNQNIILHHTVFDQVTITNHTHIHMYTGTYMHAYTHATIWLQFCSRKFP